MELHICSTFDRGIFRQIDREAASEPNGIKIDVWQFESDQPQSASAVSAAEFART